MAAMPNLRFVAPKVAGSSPVGHPAVCRKIWNHCRVDTYSGSNVAATGMAVALGAMDP